MELWVVSNRSFCFGDELPKRWAHVLRRSRLRRDPRRPRLSSRTVKARHAETMPPAEPEMHGVFEPASSCEGGPPRESQTLRETFSALLLREHREVPGFGSKLEKRRRSRSHLAIIESSCVLLWAARRMLTKGDFLCKAVQAPTWSSRSTQHPPSLPQWTRRMQKVQASLARIATVCSKSNVPHKLFREIRDTPQTSLDLATLTRKPSNVASCSGRSCGLLRPRLARRASRQEKQGVSRSITGCCRHQALMGLGLRWLQGSCGLSG